MKKRRLSLILVVLLTFCSTVKLEAAGDHYIIDDSRRIYIPDAYTLKKVFNSFVRPDGTREYLKQPEDLFINSQGYLYIADTGNNRVLKIDTDGNLADIYTGPDDTPFIAPKGVFADDFGNMYVADTKNSRIVHLDAQGIYVEEFIKPVSELIDENSSFEPSKISISKTGYIYIIKGESIMTLDANNNFRGYLGQTDIPFSFLEVLLRIVASDEQKRVVKKRLAPVYTNIFIDDEGSVYVTSMDRVEGEIKKLNSVGENIYRKYKKGSVGSQTDGKKFKFGEESYETGTSVLPRFVDITVDKNGIVTALEANTGKLYQYDKNGNNLAVFGGKGNFEGYFKTPVSVVVSEDGKLFVLDYDLGNIQVFEPTFFISLVHEASYLFSSGMYNEAWVLWEEILKIDSTYQMAVMGVANSLHKQEYWKEAMDVYKMAESKVAYSKSFVEYRYEMLRQYFIWIVFAAILLLILIIFVIAKMRKTARKTLDGLYTGSYKKIGIVSQLKMSLGAVFFPGETFERIKYNRGKLNILSAIIIFALVFATRIFYLTTVHFTLQTIALRDTNIFLEAVKILLPAFTWVIASFYISSIIEGESKIDEIFVATSFCFVPYILINIPLALFSNLLSQDEKGLFAFISYLAIVWIFLLIFHSFKTLNDYRFSKSIGGYVLSGLTILLIWVICILAYVSSGRIFQFGSGILREIRMKWF